MSPTLFLEIFYISRTCSISVFWFLFWWIWIRKRKCIFYYFLTMRWRRQLVSFFVADSVSIILQRQHLDSWWSHQMETFLRHWPFVKGIRWIPTTKASDVELWYFIWSAPEQTVGQTIETAVIWDTIVLMTSLYCAENMAMQGIIASML